MSASGLLRQAWRELWQRYRVGTLLLMAFWYTLIISLYQGLAASRLGAELPSSFKHLTVATMTSSGILSQITPSLWVKLALVYLTFFIVIMPFVVGGLYGGVAFMLKRREVGPAGSFMYFRQAVKSFWQTLGLVLLSAAMILVLAVILILILGLLGSTVGSVGAILDALIVLAVISVMLAFWLYWVGAIYYGEVATWRAWRGAIAWVSSHLGFSIRFSLLTVGLAIVWLAISAILAVVPVVGTFISLVLDGMIFPAFMAVLAFTLYREAGSYAGQV